MRKLRFSQRNLNIFFVLKFVGKVYKLKKKHLEFFLFFLNWCECVKIKLFEIHCKTIMLHKKSRCEFFMKLEEIFTIYYEC